MAGKFEKQRGRLNSSYLFIISGILFIIYSSLNLVYYFITWFIPISFNVTSTFITFINLLNFAISLSLNIMFVSASILIIIIGAKNIQYFHLIITGSLYISTVIISFIFSFNLNFLIRSGVISSFNITMLYNMIEIVIEGIILLAAEISFLLFSLKYEKDFEPIKNRFKTTGILLVIVASLSLIYYAIYLGFFYVL